MMATSPLASCSVNSRHQRDRLRRTYRVRALPTPRHATTICLHAAAGAALATIGLAVAANLHEQPESQRVLMLTTLVTWPALVAIPAFVVALLGATLLRRVSRTR